MLLVIFGYRIADPFPTCESKEENFLLNSVGLIFNEIIQNEDHYIMNELRLKQDGFLHIIPYL